MTLKKLASTLALKEGKKSQARVGDIMELLAIMVQMEVDTGHEPVGPNGFAAGDVIMFFVEQAKKKLAKKSKKKAAKK